MRLDIDVAGSVLTVIGEHIRDGQRAATVAMRHTARSLKDDWRQQVVAAGLGPRLANTVRSRSYPGGGAISMDAAALIWTNAPDILVAFERGVTIRGRDGNFLAIPTDAAGRNRGRRMTPGDWEQRTGLRLRHVYRRGRTSLLVAEARLNKAGLARASRSSTGRNVATVPIFVLVPQVTLPKTLDMFAAADAENARIPDRFLRAWSARNAG